MATNYREILRLAKLGYSQRSIAASAGCARSTVQRVLERAESNPHTLEELLARVIYPFHAEAAGLRARPPGTGKKRRDSKLALE